MKKAALLVICAIIAGCAAKKEAPSVSDTEFRQNPELPPSAESLSSGEEPQKPGPGAPSPRPEDPEKTRKLVKRAELRLQVPRPDGLEAPVREAMEKYGAYAARAESGEASRYYVIRVPAGFYDPLLTELKGLGRVLSRSESAEDVTLSYYDLEGRLKTKEELRDTFRKYLGAAKTIEDIMAVETRLAQEQNEIDWMGTELRSLANLVDYASITLWVQGPPASSPLDRPLLGERVAGVVGGFGNFAGVALVTLLGILLYGIPALAVAALFYWLLLGRIGLLKKLWRLVSVAGGRNKV